MKKILIFVLGSAICISLLVSCSIKTKKSSKSKVENSSDASFSDISASESTQTANQSGQDAAVASQVISSPKHSSSQNKSGHNNSSVKKTYKSSKKSSSSSGNYGKPLTQYFLVEIVVSGVVFREENEMARVVKSLGFNVTIYNDGTLTANRGGTSIELIPGNVDYCYINFANSGERYDFEDSLIRSHWVNHGSYYSHSSNGRVSMYAKINGNSATLACSTNGVPYGF